MGTAYETYIKGLTAFAAGVSVDCENYAMAPLLVRMQSLLQDNIPLLTAYPKICDEIVHLMGNSDFDDTQCEWVETLILTLACEEAVLATLAARNDLAPLHSEVTQFASAARANHSLSSVGDLTSAIRQFERKIETQIQKLKESERSKKVFIVFGALVVAFMVYALTP